MPRLSGLVAPEFRPTLRDELAPLRPGLRRAIVAGLVALVVLLAAGGLYAARRHGAHVVRHAPVVFNLYHPRSLRAVGPPRGELLHLEHRGAHGRLSSLFVVEPLKL